MKRSSFPTSTPEPKKAMHLQQIERHSKALLITLSPNLLLTISSRSEISLRRLVHSEAKLTLMVGSEQVTISLEQLPEDSPVTSATSEPEPISKISKTQSGPSLSV